MAQTQQNAALSRSLLNQCDEVSQIFKSLSNPTRLQVLCLILEKNRTVNELTELCDTSQSSMSQLLTRMRTEKIIDSEKVATRVYYHLAEPKLIKLLKSVKELYC